MDIRKATPADTQAIVNITLAATVSESQLHYCFPRLDKSSDGHASSIKSAVEHCLTSPEDWLVAVVEVPEAQDPRTNSIVSVAIWWASSIKSKVYDDDPFADGHLLKQILGPSVEGQDDSGPAYLSAFIEATARGREAYLYGYGKQMHLYLLATHPHHQRKGYAKALCAWGLKRAAEQMMAMSTLATAKGYILFSGLGFADVGCVSVKADGEGEELILKAMAHAAAKERRRSSVLRFLGLG